MNFLSMSTNLLVKKIVITSIDKFSSKEKECKFQNDESGIGVS